VLGQPRWTRPLREQYPRAPVNQFAHLLPGRTDRNIYHRAGVLAFSRDLPYLLGSWRMRFHAYPLSCNSSYAFTTRSKGNCWMSKRNIETLRGRLFKVLQTLDDDTRPLDIARQRAVCETAQTLIDSLKVEVELHAILRGAIDVPFIESQSSERPNSAEPARTPGDRNAALLAAGPNPEHVWRKSAVHRLPT
jgi:hypothetical protein